MFTVDVKQQCNNNRLLKVALKKESWTEDYPTETLYISNSKSNNDYVVRLFKYIFHIILVFLDVLRTPNYSSEGGDAYKIIYTTSTSTGLISL